MAFSSRGWPKAAILLAVLAGIVFTASAMLDGATQAEYAAAAAQTTTSAEPALPLWTPAAAGVIALVLGPVAAWASGAAEDD